MDSTDLIQLLQKSFHVTLGATASLVEILQDPEKREQNLSKLRLEFSELAQEWSEKGEVTETEARSFMDGFLSQYRSQESVQSPESTSTATASVTSPNTQLELQELTAQLAAIRAELGRLQNDPSP